MSRPAKIVLLGIPALLAVLVLAAIVYLRSDSFRRLVQGKIVAQLEQVTGGRVELRAYTFNVRKLQAELHGLVIRGLEKDPNRPYLAADSVYLELKITSLLKREIDYRLLRLNRPRINVMIDSKGNSNIPEPRTKREQGRGPLDKIWDLAIKRLEVIDGEMMWNDRRIPLRFEANDVDGHLAYELMRGVYTGKLSFRTNLPPADEGRPMLASMVNADLQLTRSTLDIPGLTITTGKSRIEASGQLANFLQPKIALNYKADVDVPELARVRQHPELRGGRAFLTGSMEYDTGSEKLVSAGDIRIERLDVRRPEIHVANIYGRGKYRTDGERLDLSSLQLSALGGKLAGNASITDLSHSPNVRINADASGFSVAQLARLFSTPQMPLEELRLAGAATGRIQAQFEVPAEPNRDYRNLVVESTVAITPPAVTPPGMLPLTGNAQLTYTQAGNRLEVRQTTLQTPATTVTADGALGTTSRGAANLRLTATTTNLEEFEPFLAAMRRGKKPVDFQLQGRASFNGVLTGSVSAPSVEGRVEAANFRYGATQWTSFTGDVAYSPSLLRVTNAELRREGSFARLNLTANLRDGELTDNTPLTVQANVQGARIADLQALAGTNYPVTGMVDANVQISGTKTDPRGGGTVTVTQGTIAGEPFDSLRANLTFANNEVRADNIVLAKANARVTGTAQYRTTDKSYRFQFAGERVPLGDIGAIRSQKIALGGVANFKASGTGTVDEPSLDATLQVSDLVVNEERIGVLNAVVETRNKELRARLSSKFLRGDIRGDIKATLTGDFPAAGRIEFAGIDVDALLHPSVRQRITNHSNATGVIDIAGPLKKPEALAVTAELSSFAVGVEQVDVKNAGPIRASYRNGTINIEQAHLTGTQTDVQVTGTIRLTGTPSQRTLNVRAEGNINMALVRTVNPDLTGSGQVIVNASATGTLARPLFTGRAEFQNGEIAMVDFPTGLSKMNGVVTFDTRRINVQKLTAEAGGGDVTMSGFVDLDESGGPPAMRLRADARGVRLRYPEGTSSLLNSSLTLTGTMRQSTLSGEVTVARFRFDPRFDLASALGLARVPPRTGVINPTLAGMQLDVHVVSSPDIRFEFSQARNLQMEADMRLRGTAARPAVLGRINLIQGEIYFAGTQYVINRGDISFINPVKIEPVVNLSLQTRAQQYEITIDLNGPVDRMNVSYRSDPPMPSNEIQALLITGRTRESASSAPSQTFPQIGANTILSQALNSAVSSRIERIFGVSRVKIDPQVGGPETNPGARVTLEQQVTQDVRFTYITNLSESQQQVIQVEWNINPRWSVIAVRDRNGLFGIDLKWRKRFK